MLCGVIFILFIFNLPLIALAPRAHAAVSPYGDPANQSIAAHGEASTDPINPIPPGTRITQSNWQSFRQYMPDGMIALFEGKYFWKMPAGVGLEVGPTVLHPLPKNYVDATEQYASQVKLVELPDGGITLSGYRGGVPFPNPAEPHKGWKVLANLWFRYLPHLIVDTNGYTCGTDALGQTNCLSLTYVLRQFSFNTDPGSATAAPNPVFYTRWIMLLEPEQQRYTTTLTIKYADPARAEDSYAFIPALRRYQPLSDTARCAETSGTDATRDDYQFGFDSNITQLKVEYVARRQVLTLVDVNLPRAPFPAGFELPLGWPQNSLGKWQVRNVDEISVSSLPGHQGCYGKRALYVDSLFNAALWVENYDTKMRLEKIHGIFPHTVDAPGIGPVNVSGADAEVFWNVQQNHATYVVEPALDGKHYVNEQAPKEYNDIQRYSTPSGLNLIMR